MSAGALPFQLSELLLSWVLAPAILVALCLGAGLLVSSLVGSPRLGLLTGPVGMAVLAIVASGTTLTSSLAPFTVWLMGAVGGAGGVAWLILRQPRRIRIPWAPIVAAMATFAAFAAPVVMSGRATWAGWVKLDDGASWLAFTDFILSAGHTPPQPMVSTYDALINVSFFDDTWGWFGYPRGAFPLLGAMSSFSGVDAAWLMQPYMAVMAAFLSTVLFWILSRLMGRGALTAVASVVSSLAATYYAYALWGGVKEVLLTLLVATMCASAAWAVGRRLRPRLLAYPIVVAVALVAVTGASAAGAVVPVGVGVAFLAWWQRRPQAALVTASALAGTALVVVVLAWIGAVGLRVGVEFPDMGNLIAPLSPWQAVGIWFNGDFRLGTQWPVAAAAVIAVAVMLAVAGVIFALLRRQWALPLFTGSSVVMVAYGQYTADAWLAGKILASASPSIIAAAFAGVGWLLHEGRRSPDRASRLRRSARPVAVGAAALLAGGVLWSDALAYRQAWLAPRDRVAELEAIGEEFWGQGPALMVEPAYYATRHFLRGMQAEAASELRVNSIPLRDGTLLPPGSSADIDAFPAETLANYPILVLRRSPLNSRPPADYRLERAGRYYEVWRRDPSLGVVTDGLALQGAAQPGAVPDCQQVRDLAARSTGVLVAAKRRPVIEVPLTATAEDGVASTAFTVPEDGAYEIWVAGSFPDRLEVAVDGRPVFSGSSVIDGDSSAVTPLGDVTLSAGQHLLQVRRSAPLLLPGAAAGPFPLGPFYLASETAAGVGLVEVQREDADRLCGLTLDWVQAVTR